MAEHPLLQEDNTSLFVEFFPKASFSVSRPLKVVLDINREGKIIGIEVINFILQAGEKALDLIKNTIFEKFKDMKFSYDAECDCLYIKLFQDDSINQKATQGTIITDSEGRMLALHFPKSI